MGRRERIRRASPLELVVALALSLVLYPYLVLVFGLGATSDSTGMVVFVFVAPAVAWSILAAFVVRRWRRGWEHIWKLPLVILMGGLFWPALFLLFSRSVRGALLPEPPVQGATYCASCGSPLPADARYCPSCGTSRAPALA